MNRKTYLLMSALCILAFILYVASVLFQSDFWSNILSPFSTAFAAVALFYTYARARDFKLHWLLCGIACLAWTAADVLWAIDDLVLGLDPEGSLLIMVLYLLPSCLFAASSAWLVGTQRKIWNQFQLMLDILAVASIVLTMIWILFLGQAFEALLQMNAASLLLFVGALADFFTLCCVMIWILSLEDWSLSPAMKIFVNGLLIYVIADLIYAYQFIKETYTANNLLDAVYLLALLLAGLGGLLQTWRMDNILTASYQETEKSRHNRKSAALLLAPVILVLIKGFDWRETAFLVGIFVVHQVISGYITSARVNERLLQHEKRMNQLLEEQIVLRTRELVAINKELENVSNHDTITSFFNRRYFLIAFDRLLKETKVGETVVLFFADLDRFKSINDTHGHDIGDQVLVEISRRIKAWNIYDAILARLGGDEFVFAVRGSYGEEDAAKMADDLIGRCHEPIVVPPCQFQVTMCIGITFYPFDAQERGSLMKNADIAMYHAKAQGCSQYAFYSSLIQEQVARKAELETMLAQADFDQEFELYFQPIFATADRTLTGAEALLHWNSPILGKVPPSEFIPIAEEIGIIIPLGEWVLREAASKILEWNRRYGRQMRISINISPKQLDAVRFTGYLSQLVQQAGIQAEWLDLEIVEHVAMKGAEPITTILQTLSGIGVAVSIDNFGTGYSSLSYLQRYAIDRLKIARPLVENIAVSASEYQIVKAIILMAKALGIRTTAEGVETVEQLMILAELECDEVQGYLTGQPMTALELEATCLRLELQPVRSLA